MLDDEKAPGLYPSGKDLDGKSQKIWKKQQQQYKKSHQINKYKKFKLYKNTFIQIAK